MEFDELLTKHIGPFGRYQALCALAFLFHPVPYFLGVVELIYQGKIPNYHCVSNYASRQLQSKWNLTQQEITKITSPTEEFQAQKQCHIVERDWGNLTRDTIELLLNNSVDTGETVSCHEYQYDSQFGISIVETFDLVCGSEIWVATAQTCFLTGMLVGVFGFGWLSDRIGRRISMLIGQSLAIAARVFTIFAPTITWFSIARFLSGAASFGWFTVGHVWGMEMTAPKWRSKIVLAGTFSFAFVYCICSGMIYLCQDWKMVTVYNSLFYIPYLLYYCILPESPRWLYVVGRSKEADNLVRKIAAFNNVQLPNKLEITIQNKQNHRNPLILFKTREMAKRTIANSIIWFATSMVTYGILLNTVNLVGNTYYNIMLKGAMAALSTILILPMVEVRFIGRRITILACMFVAGICLILMVVVPKDLPAVSITLYMMGALLITMVFNTIYLHTPETMPTEIRSTGMSAANVMARVGGMISPYIALLGATAHNNLPSIIMGVISMVTGFAVLLLPETRGKTLPDTIAQVEAYAKEKTRGKRNKSKDKEDMGDTMKEKEEQSMI